MMKTVCFFNQQIKFNSDELNEFLNSEEVSFYFDEINLLSAGEKSIKVKIDDDSSPFHRRCVVEQFKVRKIIENDIKKDIKEIAEEMILDEDEVEKITEIYSELKKSFVYSLIIEGINGNFLSLIIDWLQAKFNVVNLVDVAYSSLYSENKTLSYPDISNFDNKYFEDKVFVTLHPNRMCSTFKTEKGLQTVFNEQYSTPHFALNKKSLNLSFFSIWIISFLMSTGFFVFSIALIQNEYLNIFAFSLFLSTPFLVPAIIHASLANDFLYNRQQKKIIKLLNNKCENDKAYSEQELFDFSVKTGIDLPKEYKKILRKIAPASNGFINYRDENILKLVQENQNNVIELIKKNPEMLIDISSFMKHFSSEEINEYMKGSLVVIPINDNFGFLCDNLELHIYEINPFRLLKIKNSFAKILGQEYNGESGFYNYLINFLKKQ